MDPHDYGLNEGPASGSGGERIKQEGGAARSYVQHINHSNHQQPILNNLMNMSPDLISLLNLSNNLAPPNDLQNAHQQQMHLDRLTADDIILMARQQQQLQQELLNNNFLLMALAAVMRQQQQQQQNTQQQLTQQQQQHLHHQSQLIQQDFQTVSNNNTHLIQSHNALATDILSNNSNTNINSNNNNQDILDYSEHLNLNLSGLNAALSYSNNNNNNNNNTSSSLANALSASSSSRNNSAIVGPNLNSATTTANIINNNNNNTTTSSSLLTKLSAVTQRPDSHKLATHLDSDMIELLEAFYAINSNPEPAAIDMIAKRINTPSELIASWFEQKRLGLNPFASPPSPPAKKREGGRVVTFSEYQRSLLEAIFDENNYLHPQEYEELSNLIQVPSRNIKIWFKNRRSKQRLSGRCTGINGGANVASNNNNHLHHSHRESTSPR